MASHILDKGAPAVQPRSRKKGERTRERILDLAYASIIAKGFSATSIEELVEGAGITKSGFFYHFRDKHDLALQIIERFRAENGALMDALSARARELEEDPLHSLLIFLKLYGEAMIEIVARHPGCLVATITFQEQAFHPDVTRHNAETLADWRGRFVTWLKEAAEAYPPASRVDVGELADGLVAQTIGGIVLSKLNRDPAAIGRQILFYRDLIRMIFKPS